jgi:hypothetical protein
MYTSFQSKTAEAVAPAHLSDILVAECGDNLTASARMSSGEGGCTKDSLHPLYVSAKYSQYSPYITLELQLNVHLFLLRDFRYHYCGEVLIEGARALRVQLHPLCDLGPALLRFTLKSDADASERRAPPQALQR